MKISRNKKQTSGTLYKNIKKGECFISSTGYICIKAEDCNSEGLAIDLNDGAWIYPGNNCSYKLLSNAEIFIGEED